MRKPFIIFVFKGIQAGINDSDKAVPERQGELTLKKILYTVIQHENQHNTVNCPIRLLKEIN